jgi:hypothetical protein
MTELSQRFYGLKHWHETWCALAIVLIQILIVDTYKPRNISAYFCNKFTTFMESKKPKLLTVVNR